MTVTARRLAAAGAILGFLGVAAGAFGAHALRARLPADLLTIFETGARYHVYHSLALFAVAWLSTVRPGRLLALAGGLFVAGVLVFSGSLYLLALTGVRTWGAVTPVGGAFLLAGWALTAFALISGQGPGESPSR